MTHENTGLFIHDFLALAEVLAERGREHARRDDPHKFGRIPDAFDGGNARKRQVVIDWQVDGRVSVSERFIGSRHGVPQAVVLWSVRLSAVPPDAEVQ